MRLKIFPYPPLVTFENVLDQISLMTLSLSQPPPPSLSTCSKSSLRFLASMADSRADSKTLYYFEIAK